MKLSQLKTIVKEAVKEAIQEEMKDILMETVHFWMRAHGNNNFLKPSCRSLKEEDICWAISVEILLLFGTDIYFVVAD